METGPTVVGRIGTVLRALAARELELATAQLEQRTLRAPISGVVVERYLALGEYIDHHVKEEESELFPQVRKAKLDVAALGEQLNERKMALMSEMGMMAEEEESEEA